MQNQPADSQQNSNRKSIQDIYDDCKKIFFSHYNEMINYALDIRKKVLDERYQWTDEEELAVLLDKDNLIAKAEHWPTDNLRLYWKNNLNIIRDMLKQNSSITPKTYYNLMQEFKLRRRSQRFNRLICTLFPGQLLFIPAADKISQIKIPGLTDTDDFSKKDWIEKNLALFKYCSYRIEDHDKDKSFYISCFAWYWREYLITNGKAELSDSNINLKIEFPLQRIVFGAPGTGKSYRLEKESEFFKESFDLSSKLKEEFSVIDKGANYVPQCYAIGIKYGKKILEQFPKETKKEINTILEKGKDDIAGYYITTGAQASLFLPYAQNSNENNRFERVTFHPNYSYAQFVGAYKPVTKETEEIAYEYVPGPFMRVYAAAKQNPAQNFLLIIEEINRANVAAVFGDVFQLLDRDRDGNSEYPVTASEDVRKYLEQKGVFETELSIPSNMYIWATMNSADQGVMPIDAAFKRRWNFEYIGIDDNENWEYEIPLPNNDRIIWNVLRKAINDKLKQIQGVNEDKLLGPYFISKNTLDSLATADEEAKKRFIETFKSKVLMYLFEDVVKMRPKALFEGITEERPHYSDICNAFNEKGIGIFGFNKEELNLKYPKPREESNQQQEPEQTTLPEEQ